MKNEFQIGDLVIYKESFAIVISVYPHYKLKFLTKHTFGTISGLAPFKHLDAFKKIS